MQMSNITDKVVVITGASSGIGESTAKLLAERGAKVVLGARRSNRIGAVVKEISATGGKAIGFATDVTKRAEVEALIKGAVNGSAASMYSSITPVSCPSHRSRLSK
jgi:NADP-dependent 3-hydroxy acid dehydrogenase YdfG